MRHVKSMMMFFAALTLMVSGVAGLAAQTPAAPPANETATQFYVRYLAAFEKSTKVDDLLPYISADMKKQVESTPANKRAEMFEMMKMMGGMNTGIKVTREQRTAKGATLTAEASDPEKKKVTGTIEIVREGNAWKLGTESWKN